MSITNMMMTGHQFGCCMVYFLNSSSSYSPKNFPFFPNTFTLPLTNKIITPSFKKSKNQCFIGSPKVILTAQYEVAQT